MFPLFFYFQIPCISKINRRGSVIYCSNNLYREHDWRKSYDLCCHQAKVNEYNFSIIVSYQYPIIIIFVSFGSRRCRRWCCCSVLYNVRLLSNPLCLYPFVYIFQKGNMPLRIYWKNGCIDYCKYGGKITRASKKKGGTLLSYKILRNDAWYDSQLD